MSRLPLVVSLAVVAAAALVALPAADVGAAYAVQAEPGMILVWDLGSSRTQAFYPNGTFALDHWLSYFDSTDVAFYPDGRLVRVEAGGSSVHVFYPNGTRMLSFGTLGLDPGEFRSIRTVAVDPSPDGLIFIRDRGHGTQAFYPNGTFAFPLEAGLRGTHLYDRIAVGLDGRIFTAGGYGPVDVHYPNGTWAFAFGPDGLVTGPIVADEVFDNDVPNVAVGPDGRVFLLTDEGRSSSVRVHYPNGTFDHSFGSWARTSTFAVGSDGRVYAPGSFYTIHVYHPNGTFAFPFGTLGRDQGEFDTIHAIVAVPGPNPTWPPGPPPAPVTVVIEPGAPAGPLNFTDAGHAANLTIDVAGLAGPGGAPLDGSASSVVTFPPTETSVAASFATVTFPPDVTAAHVPAGGRLALRVTADVPDDARAQGALAYEGSGRVTLQRVIEVGGASGRVTFDMPVRILLEGQAGGRAFYIEGAGGTITPIDQACAADDTARVHRHLGGAGECQVDSADGNKIIYTYHLTMFGTALPVGAAPPPVVHTCSVAIGMPDLGMSARAGERSAPVRQEVINSGSAPFDNVGLMATPWLAAQGAGPLPSGPAPAPPAPVFGTASARMSTVLTASLVWSLPASVTEISTAAAGGPYTALADETAVARGLGGGDSSPLWFRLNLSSHGDAQGGTLVQEVTYQATCRVP